jgi:hypothetical protein
MSTRSVVTVKDERDTFHIYKHSAGYPSGVAEAIAAAVKAMCARIALGLPIAGDTSDASPDGGARVPRVRGPSPRSPLRGLAVRDLTSASIS